MDKKPLVSVIIPTYKSNTTLKAAIESVLNQTYDNIEIIVVDDNDPKTKYRETTEICMKEYANNSKVVYIKHEKNKNGAAARNTGFKISKGDYICFLDDDDNFLETKVEKQVRFLENHGKFHGVYTWRYQNKKIIKYCKSGDLSEELLSLTFTPYTSSIMLKRECYKVLNGFDESYRRHQDYEFLLRFFEFYLIGVIEEPLVQIVGNNVDNALHGRELELLKQQFLKNFSSHIERIERERKGFKKLVYAKHYSSLFWDCLSRGKITIATRVLIKYSFMCNVVFWKTLFSSFQSRVKAKMADN